MTQAIEALGGFLSSVNFTQFATFTSRLPISLNSTRRIAQRVGNFIDAGRSSTYFWAAEKFDVRDGYHFHALLRTQTSPIELFAWYFARYGRCDIIDNTDPDRRKSASYYCSKYVTKELADYDVYFGDEIRMRSQTSLHSFLSDFDRKV